MNLRHTSSLFTAALLTWAIGLGSAGAASITYTGIGTGADGPLAAQAIFTTSNGQISVVLSNELAASVIRSPGQGLSDITFTLSNNAGTLGAQTAAGQFGNISSTGVVTYVASDAQTGNTSPIRWFSGTGAGVSGSTVKLETIGGGQPSQMIAPTLANGGTYTNANNGLQNFNSFVVGPATFTIALSSVTANTTVTAVTFSFGTKAEYTVTGTNAAVPEPSSLILAGIGGLGIIGMVRHSRRS